MEKTRVLRRYPLRNAGLVVLAALLAVYIPFKARTVRSERAGEKPSPGTKLSIFFTSRLGGYREPCG